MTWLDILNVGAKVLAVTVIAALVIIIIYSVVYVLVKGSWR